MPISRAFFSAPLRVLVLFFAALAVTLPFFFRGPACGADFIFHYSSWHDVLSAWHSGLLYPHWARSANFLAGEPRFVFYPPVTWMLGAALGAFLPWHLVPIVLNFLIFFATGLATAALARRFVSPVCSTVAGCLAMSSGYSLYESYSHSDFALLTGGFWIPLLLLTFVWQPSSSSPRFVGVLDRRTLVLACLLTGTWLSNTPLGLMATYLLCTVALLTAWQMRSWQPVLRLVPVLALGLGLAGFYLVPATLEQRWVDILALIATPEHQIQHRWITSELLNSHDRTRGIIEATMLALALGALALTRFRNTWPDSDQPELRRQWLVLVFLPLAILFLLLPISYPVWLVVPRLRFLQYPWRWLVVLQAPMAIFLGAALWSFRPRWRHAATALCGLLVLFLIFRWGRSDTRFHACDAASGIFSIAAMDRALSPGGEGVGGFEEYVSPIGASNRLLPTQLPDACLVQDAGVVLSNVPGPSEPAWYKPLVWSPDVRSCRATFSQTAAESTPEHIVLRAQIPEAGFLILRLRSYPLWQISLNGALVSARAFRPDGLLAVPVPQGPVSVTVDWFTGTDVLLGRALSLLSLLAVLVLAWAVRPHRSQPDSPPSRST